MAAEATLSGIPKVRLPAVNPSSRCQFQFIISAGRCVNPSVWEAAYPQRIFRATQFSLLPSRGRRWFQGEILGGAMENVCMHFCRYIVIFCLSIRHIQKC